MDTRGFDEALYEVLAMRRYDRLMGRSIDMQGWLTDRLEWLFEQLFGGLVVGEGAEFNISAIAAVFAAVGVVIVVFAAFIIVRSLLRNRAKNEHGLNALFAELQSADYTVSGLIGLSDRASDQREMVRFRYIAALLALNERQLIEVKPSATNRVIEKQLRKSSPELSPSFSAIAHAFHFSWFGFKEIGQESLYEFKNAVARLAGDPKKVAL